MSYPDAKRLEELLAKYEFEVEYIQEWHMRCIYDGIAVFDFYPKRHKLFDLKTQKRYQLSRQWGDTWLKQISNMLDDWIFTNEIKL